jgi:hypothetical protein
LIEDWIAPMAGGRDLVSYIAGRPAAAAIGGGFRLRPFLFLRSISISNLGLAREYLPR